MSNCLGILQFGKIKLVIVSLLQIGYQRWFLYPYHRQLDNHILSSTVLIEPAVKIQLAKIICAVMYNIAMLGLISSVKCNDYLK